MSGRRQLPASAAYVPSRNSLRARSALDRAREQIENVRWGEQTLLLSFDGWDIRICNKLPDDAVFVSSAMQLVALSTETWETLSEIPSSRTEFLHDMTRGGEMGVKLMVTDAGYYGDAKRVRSTREAIRAGKDPLQVLEEELDRLVLQAAGLNREPSAGQLKIFFERIGEADETVAAMRVRMQKIEAMLSLAKTAVYDVAS